MTATRSTSRRRRVAASPSRPSEGFQARKRYALKLMSQANDNNRKHALVKRKRSVVTYSSSSNTDEDELSGQEEDAFARHHSKRPRPDDHQVGEPKSVIGDGENPLGLSVWDGDDLDDAPGGNGRQDEPFFALDYQDEDELTVEYARSSEVLEEVDLIDIYGDYLHEESSCSSNDEDLSHKDAFCERLVMQRYIRELQSLLTRRRRNTIVSRRARNIDDEPLRVKLTNLRFKNRLNAGNFTKKQIQEVIQQRPLCATYGDLNIPTPRTTPEPEMEPETCDLTETKSDNPEPPERPSTPIPQSDSGSEYDSDSDEEGTPIYSASQISQHLSRREMESLGIYPDDDE